MRLFSIYSETFCNEVIIQTNTLCVELVGSSLSLQNLSQEYRPSPLAQLLSLVAAPQRSRYLPVVI